MMGKRITAVDNGETKTFEMPWRIYAALWFRTTFHGPISRWNWFATKAVPTPCGCGARVFWLGRHRGRTYEGCVHELRRRLDVP